MFKCPGNIYMLYQMLSVCRYRSRNYPDRFRSQSICYGVMIGDMRLTVQPTNAINRSFHDLVNIYDCILDTWKCRYGLRRWRIFLKRRRLQNAALFRALELARFRRLMLPARIEYLYQETFKCWAQSCKYKRRLKIRVFTILKSVWSIRKVHTYDA
jgi:hypothetical protein